MSTRNILLTIFIILAWGFIIYRVISVFRSVSVEKTEEPSTTITTRSLVPTVEHKLTLRKVDFSKVRDPFSPSLYPAESTEETSKKSAKNVEIKNIEKPGEPPLPPYKLKTILMFGNKPIAILVDRNVESGYVSTYQVAEGDNLKDAKVIKIKDDYIILLFKGEYYYLGLLKEYKIPETSLERYMKDAKSD